VLGAPGPVEVLSIGVLGLVCLVEVLGAGTVGVGQVGLVEALSIGLVRLVRLLGLVELLGVGPVSVCLVVCSASPPVSAWSRLRVRERRVGAREGSPRSMATVS
jgi:hypothetical protein